MVTPSNLQAIAICSVLMVLGDINMHDYAVVHG